MGMRNVNSSEIRPLTGNLLLCPALMSSDESRCQQIDLLCISPALNFIAVRQGTTAQGECWVKANLWCSHQKCMSLCQLWQLRPRGRGACSQLGDLAFSKVSVFPEEVFHLAANRAAARSAQPIPSKSTLQSTSGETTAGVPPSVSPCKTPLPWKNTLAAAEF